MDKVLRGTQNLPRNIFKKTSSIVTRLPSLQDMRKVFSLLPILLGVALAMEEEDRMNQVVLKETAFVSKVEPRKPRPWSCDCYNTTEVNQTEEVECRCHGKELKAIPTDLPGNLHRLTITDSEIKNLSRNSLQPYKDTLRDV